jgi:adenosylcobinamide-phosphate synthase
LDLIFIFLLAMALDLAVGEPPNAIHPVAWMGQVIAFLSKGGKGFSAKGQLVYGILIILVTLALFVTPVYFLLAWLKSLNIIVM